MDLEASPARTVAMTRPPSAAHVGRWRVLAAAAASGLAALIHAALIGKHFEEGALFGVAFTAMAVYQIVLAVALVARPGQRAYRAGICGSGLIVATYIATRVVPTPTAALPEEITALGVLASTLELATLILLVRALPDTDGRQWPLPAWLFGAVAAAMTPPMWVFVTGALQWTPPVAGQVPSLRWSPGSLSQLEPALYGYVTNRLYLFLPWWALAGALLLGALVGANVWLATKLRRERRSSCRRRRTGLLGLLPAAFAAPVCCGIPLAAIFGLSTATLFAAAPIATAASIGLLTGNVVSLASRRRRQPDVDC